MKFTMFLEQSDLDLVNYWFDHEVVTEANETFVRIKNVLKRNKTINTDVESSSCIAHVYYEPSKKYLVLTFKKTGAKYEYKNVDKRSLLNLLSNNQTQGSIGKAFWKDIRPNSNKFPYKRIA